MIHELKGMKPVIAGGTFVAPPADLTGYLRPFIQMCIMFETHLTHRRRENRCHRASDLQPRP
ncbi:MAG: hypothetical protein A2Y96_01430 [Firmicutes bacterium RBG_13_65_8]|nr:MAG: hypothetical protein A2Y96_01430 [Firmicutes bacterium RBG_13_65_8]